MVVGDVGGCLIMLTVVGMVVGMPSQLQKDWNKLLV